MKIILDCNYMRTEEEMHKYLKEKLNLPEYYGENLDALYDCLSETEGLAVEFINRCPEDRKIMTIEELMEDAGVEIV